MKGSLSGERSTRFSTNGMNPSPIQNVFSLKERGIRVTYEMKL
jgi:hypothetical protein